MRERVVQTRERQLARSAKANHQLNSHEIEQYCDLKRHDRDLLGQAIERLGLSARASHRILRVARTIADLGGSEKIETAHLSEAISYRRVDRQPQAAFN